MRIVTSHADDIAEWIDATLGETTYEHDERTILIRFGDDIDGMLFDLRWAGCFIQNHVNHSWYDNTDLNQIMIAIIAGNAPPGCDPTSNDLG